MSTTRMKIGGMKKLEKILMQYPAMAERAADWEPIETELHQIVADDFKSMYKSRRSKVGDMQRLGPSLTMIGHKEHIWKMEPDGKGFTFGSAVPYSFWYAQWRRSQGKRSHIQFRARARRAVRDRIMAWIVEG